MNKQAYYNNICLLLKLIRQRKALKQEYVAHKCGITRSVYSKLENGQLKVVPLQQFVEICDVLDCDKQLVMDLAGGGVTFNYTISTWSDFIISLEKCDDESRAKMLRLAISLFAI